MGISNYFFQYYKVINEINENFKRYNKLKSEIMNSEYVIKNINNVLINTSEVERFN